MPRQAVLFLIDTLGTNYLGCYTGNPGFETPHIDQLAASGVRFDRAYCCSPVCGPARSALFTGLYPHSNGVLGNNQSPHQDLPHLGQRIQQLGIKTGYSGKWHLDGTDYFGNGRCPDGWDPATWFDGLNYLDSLPDDEARDLSRLMLDSDQVAKHHITAEFTHAHRIVDRATRFLETHRDEDFLLVISIDEPHHPYICPEPFVSRFDDFKVEVPSAHDPLDGKPRIQHEWAEHARGQRAQLTEEEGRLFMRDPLYFACNSYSDHEVGRAIAAIDALTPDALLIYTADHGNALQHHRLNGKGPAMYEDMTNIPLIVRWPGHAPRQATTAGPASHIDIIPTLLDFFGAPTPDLLHGCSLLPQIRQPATAVNEQIFIEFNRYEIDHDSFGAFVPIRCIHNGRYKLALNLLDTDEFYDLENDPNELTNLIDQPSAVRDQLHDQLLVWMDRTRDPMRGPEWQRRPWRDVARSSWGGPSRPRPFDESFQPRTRLYVTGREAHTYEFKR